MASKCKWKVGDLVHPKGAAKCMREEVVAVDGECVVTCYESRRTKELGTLRRTHAEMERYCEPW